MENAIDYNIFIILARACDNYIRKNTIFVAEYSDSSGAYDRNYVRWNEHGREHWEDEYIYEYVRGRLEFADTYFENSYFDETPK